MIASSNTTKNLEMSTSAALPSSQDSSNTSLGELIEDHLVGLNTELPMDVHCQAATPPIAAADHQRLVQTPTAFAQHFREESQKLREKIVHLRRENGIEELLAAHCIDFQRAKSLVSESCMSLSVTQISAAKLRQAADAVESSESSLRQHRDSSMSPRPPLSGRDRSPPLSGPSQDVLTLACALRKVLTALEDFFSETLSNLPSQQSSLVASRQTSANLAHRESSVGSAQTPLDDNEPRFFAPARARMFFDGAHRTSHDTALLPKSPLLGGLKSPSTPQDFMWKKSSSANSLASLAVSQRHPFQETRSLVVHFDEEGNKMINEYVMIGLLGRGSQGKVKLAEHITTKQLVAIKILNKSAKKKWWRAGEISILRRIESEIEIMKRLKHKNIVQLCEVIDDPTANKMYLVMKYVEHGALFHLRPDGTCDPFPQDRVIAVVRQLITGLRYLHRHGVIHRDVKPENILLGADNNVYLSDFGVAVMFEKDEDPYISGTQGTPLFFAPEMFDRGENSKRVVGEPVDVWALGVTAFCMTFGQLPFPGVMNDISYEVLHEPLSFPPGVDEVVVDFFSKVLERDPERRASLSSLKSHPWLGKKRKSLASMSCVDSNNCALPECLSDALTGKQQNDCSGGEDVTVSLPTMVPVATAPAMVATSRTSIVDGPPRRSVTLLFMEELEGGAPTRAFLGHRGSGGEQFGSRVTSFSRSGTLATLKPSGSLGSFAHSTPAMRSPLRSPISTRLSIDVSMDPLAASDILTTDGSMSLYSKNSINSLTRFSRHTSSIRRGGNRHNRFISLYSIFVVAAFVKKLYCRMRTTQVHRDALNSTRVVPSRLLLNSSNSSCGQFQGDGNTSVSSISGESTPKMMRSMTTVGTCSSPLTPSHAGENNMPTPQLPRLCPLGCSPKKLLVQAQSCDDVTAIGRSRKLSNVEGAPQVG